MHKRNLAVAAATAALVLGVLGSAVTLAKPGASLFELDADNPPAQPATTDNAGAGLPDDWDRIAAGTDHADSSTFDAETTSTGSANNASIFTGGGSKDSIAISGWGWKDLSGGLPDKDNLLHAMSARYTDKSGTSTDGNQYLFFGADRFDNSGDSQIGFWFFQQPVAPVAGGSFTGVHTARDTSTGQHGDILILSDFTQGGTQPTIRIFEWVGSGGSDGSVDLIGGNATDTRDCAVVSTDDFCASVNPSDGATAPWLYKNKSGQLTFGHGEFYEGGINLNNLGLQNECFPSFLAETRSSQSVTATLKDFISGSFQNCSPSLVTTPTATVAAPVTPGTSVTDTLDLTINGSTNPPAPTGTVTFYICGPLATGTCDASDSAHTGTLVGTGSALTQKSGSTTVWQSTSPAVSPTTPGRYCFRSEWPGDSHYKPVSPATKFVEFGTGDSECFAVAKIPSTTVTTPSQSSIVLGNSLTDTAVVTGTAAGGDPTGSVSFGVCGPIASGTCDGSDTAHTATALTGNPKTLVSDGVSGTYTSSATSDSYTPPSVGRYCFTASYGGSTVYNASGDSRVNECFTVTQLPTTTVTTPSSSTITLGSSITDTAVVTGSAAGGDPTGNVNFFVCQIETGSCDKSDSNHTGTAVTGNPKALVSDGVSGTYTSSAVSGSFTPTAVGRYCFRAEYVGSTTYTGSSDGSVTECFTVTDSFSNSSAQTWRPNDSATVAAAHGSPLTGTLTVTMYPTNNCSGTAVTGQTYTKTLTNATTLADRTLTTTNTTFDVLTSQSVSWLVTFTSGSTYITGSTHCEVTSLTITN
jgi:hypothetical protein